MIKKEWMWMNQLNKNKMETFTFEQIKNIAKDIKRDKKWINDSHTKSEYFGICWGLNSLIERLRHLEETKTK